MAGAGFVVAGFEDSMAGAVRALVEGAFESEAEARLVEAIRAGGVARVELVALAGGRVVGHALISEGSVGGESACWCLGPMCVAKPERGRGIGGALVEASCAAAEGRDRRPVFVLGAPGFYGRFGFEGAIERGYGCRFVTPEVQPECFMVRGDAGSGGEVSYPRAFDAFG